MHESLVLRSARLALSGHPPDGEPLTLFSQAQPLAPYRLSLPDHTVLPGLVNAHEHLQLNAIAPLPGSAHFSNSYDWSAAFQPHFQEPAVKAALAVPAPIRHWQGALKNALSGTTTVMHHDPLADICRDPGFPVTVVQPYGWAHSLHWPYGPDVRNSYHATPTNVGWFIHLAEGIDAAANAELHELDALGCLQANTVLIHGVGLRDADIQRVIEAGAALVWCPRSNLTILGQTLDTRRLRRLFEAGRLALGTDSRLSGALDLLEELKVAAAHSRFTARELVRLVTVDAHRLLRTHADNDAIIIRTGSGNPFADVLRLRRADLRAVVRAGEPLITDPDFQDWFEERSITYATVRLDGRPKLCARALLGHEAFRHSISEPGLSY
ncbi:MAG TPA: amidohydrolase family protein [Steroidobacteraceae bacterium]|nr:amidohydrolase family protein [Steroidobacteraceae bacterium]